MSNLVKILIFNRSISLAFPTGSETGSNKIFILSAAWNVGKQAGRRLVVLKFCGDIDLPHDRNHSELKISS